MGDRQRGQALVELAVLVPAVALVLLAMVAFGQIGQARASLAAVAYASARTAALAPDPGAAEAAGTGQGRRTAAGYGLSNGSLELTVNTSRFGRGGSVVAVARYTLRTLNWAPVTLAAAHAEPVDDYRGARGGG